MSADDDTASLPLPERLTHKVWKVRKGAYIELTEKFSQTLDPKDEIFDTYGKYLVGAAIDKNAIVQEFGVKLSISFLEKTEKSIIASSIYKVVDKAFGARPKTKTAAHEYFMLLFEHELGEITMEALMKGCQHRLAKIVAECISVMCEAMNAFGARHIPLKGLIAKLPKLFDHTDKNVRAQCTELATTCFRWGLTAVLQPKFDELRSAQKKELDAIAAKIAEETEKPQATRLVRSQNPEFGGKSATKAAGKGGKGGAAEKEFDPFDLEEPADVASMLTEKWYARLSEKKWSDRRTAIDELIKLCEKSPRIKPAPDHFLELAKTLKRVISKDTNVIVVARAGEVTGLLGRGLRRDFNKACKVILPAILDKFKEKKGFCVNALNTALDHLHPQVIVLAEVIDIILHVMKSKVPQVRVQTMQWMARCVEGGGHRISVRSPVLKKLIKLLIDSLEDGNPDVRNGAAKTFALLIGELGERALGPFLEKLDPVRQKKVRKHIPDANATKGTVAATTSTAQSDAPRSVSSPEAASQTATSSSKSATTLSSRTLRRGASSTQMRKKKSSRNLRATKSLSHPDSHGHASKPSAATGAQPKEVMTAAQRHTQRTNADKEYLAMNADIVWANAEDLLPDEVLTGVAASNWQERAQAWRALDEWLRSEAGLAISAENRELVLSLPYAVRPGWSESVFQAARLLCELVVTVSTLAAPLQKKNKNGKPSALTEKCVRLAIGPMLDRLTQAKSQKHASQALEELVKGAGVVVSVRSALAHLSAAQRGHRSLVDAFGWIHDIFLHYGVPGDNQSGMLEILERIRHTFLFHSAQPVRQAALRVVGVLRQYMGPSVREPLVEGLRSSQLHTLDENLRKAAELPPPVPTRAVRGQSVEASKAAPAFHQSPTAKGSSPRRSLSAAPTEAEKKGRDIQRRTSQKSLFGSKQNARGLSREENVASPSPSSNAASNAPVDLSSSIVKLVPKLKSNDWEVRRDALTQLIALLEGLGDRQLLARYPGLLSSLRERMQDTHRHLAVLALRVATLLPDRCMGTSDNFELSSLQQQGEGDEKTSAVEMENSSALNSLHRQVKHIVPNIAGCLSDSKRVVAEAALQALKRWSAHVRLPQMIAYLPAILKSESGAARLESLAWCKALCARDIAMCAPAEAIKLCKPTLRCMQDRLTDIRHAGAELLQVLLPVITWAPVKKYLSTLTPATRRQLKPLLEEFGNEEGLSLNDMDDSEDDEDDRLGRDEGVMKTKDTTERRKSGTLRSPHRPLGRRRSSSRQRLGVVKSPSSGGVAAVTTGKTLAERARHHKVVAWYLPPDAGERDLLERKKILYVQLQAALQVKEHVATLEDLQLIDLLTQTAMDSLPSSVSSPKRSAASPASGTSTKKSSSMPQEGDPRMLDLVFKWASYKLVHDAVMKVSTTHQTIVEATWKMLQTVLQAALEAKIHLYDYEAAVLLPMLPQLQVPAPQEKDSHADPSSFSSLIISQVTLTLCRLYPAARAFVLLSTAALEASHDSALVSHRACARTLLLLSVMVEKYGFSICGQPAVDIPKFCDLMAHANADIGAASLRLLGALRAQAGTEENFFQHLSSLPESHSTSLRASLATKAKTLTAAVEKEKSLLEAPSTEKKEDSASSTMTTSGKDQMKDDGLPSLSVIELCSWIDTLSEVADGVSKASSGDAKTVSEAMAVKVVDCMKLLCSRLSGNESVYVVYIDQLVSALSVLLQADFPLLSPTAAGRIHQYALNTMLRIFSNESLARSVQEEALKKHFQASLSVFVKEQEKKASADASGDQNKQTNQASVLTNSEKIAVFVISRTRENADRTVCFVVLLNLMREYAEDSENRATHYLMRCLYKMAKDIPANLAQLSVDRLLLAVHRFLTQYPPVFWHHKDKSAKKPFNTIKLVINELVKGLGQDIHDHLTLLNEETKEEQGQGTRQHVSLFIDSMLKLHFQNQSLQEALPATQKIGSNSEVPPTSSASPAEKESLPEAENVKETTADPSGEKVSPSTKETQGKTSPLKSKSSQTTTSTADAYMERLRRLKSRMQSSEEVLEAKNDPADAKLAATSKISGVSPETEEKSIRKKDEGAKERKERVLSKKVKARRAVNDQENVPQQAPAGSSAARMAALRERLAKARSKLDNNIVERARLNVASREKKVEQVEPVQSVEVLRARLARIKTSLAQTRPTLR